MVHILVGLVLLHHHHLELKVLQVDYIQELEVVLSFYLFGIQ
jgi:hypothetical protein